MGKVICKPKIDVNTDVANGNPRGIAVDPHTLDKPQKKVKSKRVASKVLILGEPNVGKTYLVNRFCEGVSFNESTMTYTNKELVHEKQREKIYIKEGDTSYNMTMNIYDCAGDNSNFNLLRIYWTDVNVIVLVYSVDSNQSFQRLQNWVEAINKTKQPNEVVHIALVASKSDLAKTVPNVQGQRFKDEINQNTEEMGNNKCFMFKETSA